VSRPAWPLLAAVAAGTAVAALGLAQEGTRAGGSVLLGTVVAVGFLALGLAPLVLLRGGEGAGLGCAVLALNYLLRLLGAGVVLAAAARSGAVDLDWTTYGLIAAALAWTLGQAAAVLVPAGQDAGHDEGAARHDEGGHGPSGGTL
jgi:hypothetical protein